MKKSAKKTSRRTLRNLKIEQLDKRELMAADLQLLLDINTRSDYAQAEVFTKRIVNVGDEGFFAFQDAEHGTELWKTDGTAEGTRRHLDLIVGVQSSDPRQLLALGDSLLFLADTDDLQTTLFRLGPQDAAPKALGKWGLMDQPSSFLVVDGLVYFTALDEYGSPALWKTDGYKLDEVSLSVDVRLGLGQTMWKVGNRVLFLTGNESHELSLVSYDGSLDQSEIVLSRVSHTKLLGTEALLIQSIDDSGKEITWFSNGTLDGTKTIESASNWNWWNIHTTTQVKDGWLLALPSATLQYQELVLISRDAIVKPLSRFETTDRSIEISPAVNGQAIVALPGIATLITDGSVENTLPLEIPSLEWSMNLSQAVTWHDKLIVPAHNAVETALLEFDVTKNIIQVIEWKSIADGVVPEWQLDAIDPTRLVIHERNNGILKEWDGTFLKLIEGEVGLIAPATLLGSRHVTIVATKQGVYAADLDRIQTPVSSVVPLATMNGVRNGDAIKWNDQIFFQAYGERGIDLWRSDGTPEGTKRLMSEIGTHARLIATDSRVLVIANGSNDLQIWETKGEPNDTRLLGQAPVQDVAWAASIADQLIVYEQGGLWSFEGDRWSRILANPMEGRMVFAPPIRSGNILTLPASEEFSNELGEYAVQNSIWQTDGTVAGTKRVIQNASFPIERSVTAGDVIYFTSNNTIYITRDRFSTIDVLATLSDGIVDLAVADSQLFVIVATVARSPFELLKWDANEGAMVRLAEYGSTGHIQMFGNRFFQSDNDLFIQAANLQTGEPIFQRIDTSSDSVRTIPAMTPFATATAWFPMFLSTGLVGPAKSPSVAEELFVLKSDSFEERDDSIPRGIEANSAFVSEDTPIDTRFARLSTLADQPGVYRYELVPGDNDNASFAIDGDQLVNLITFDRNDRDEFYLDIRTTSNSGASDVFRITLVVVPPVLPPEAMDDWGGMWANDFYVMNPMMNDIEGTRGFVGGWIEFASDARDGEWKIVDNAIHFTPTKNFVGTNTIEYLVFDRDGRASAPAKISIQVRSRFHNLLMPVDVDQDGTSGPLDALLVINAINSDGARVLDQSAVDEYAHLIDVDGDGILSPLDTLKIINWINSDMEWSGAGEQEAEMAKSSNSTPFDGTASNSIEEHDRFFEAYGEDWLSQRNRRARNIFLAKTPTS